MGYINAPYGYDLINRYNGFINPSTQHSDQNATSAFFQKYLLQDAISVWEWKLPKTWPKNFFLYTLYCWGYVAIVKTDKYGVIPQYAGLRGYNVFYQPTNAVISNPLLSGILEPKIGVECEIVRLQPDYTGILDIVTKYADIMAMTVQSAGCNIMASKLAYVFTARDKASAESFKKLFDRIASGQIAVVQDKNLLTDSGDKSWNVFANNLRNNYIAGDMLIDLQKWRNMYLTEIGINNANTEKRERLVTDEVNANNQATYSKVSQWLENCKEGCKNVNYMFGTNLSVDWRKGMGPDASNFVSSGTL